MFRSAFLAVAAVTALATVAPAVTAPEAASSAAQGSGGDEFASTSLDSGWTITGNQPDAWSLSARPGWLTVQARPASLYESDNRVVNLFTRKLRPGDATVTTRLDFAATTDIQSAGLLLFADADNYVYLSKVHQGGNAFLAGIESHGHYSSELLENTIGAVAQLRIVRTGATLRFAVRGDQGPWQQVGQPVVSSTSYPSLGLFASTNGAASVSASFDWVRVTDAEPTVVDEPPLPPDSVTPRPAAGQDQVSFQNPVQSWTSGDPSIADPGVLKAPDGYYYLVSTESEYSYSPYHALPIFRSPDLVHWKYVTDVFSDKTGYPSWANTQIADRKDFWAPDLSYYHGKYYLYYAATQKSDPDAPTNNKAIGVATADSPVGPWHDAGHPVVTGNDFRAIDPQAFTDRDGSRYLYWGSEFYPILGQQLSADGTKVVGPRHQVLPSHQGSSYFFDTRSTPPYPPNYENLIEGAWVMRRGDWYYLFYSGPNCCGPSANYAVAVARSAHPFGPYVKYSVNPILRGNDTFFAPGHNAIVSDDAGQDWIVYHAMDRTQNPSGDASRRILLIDKVQWRNGWPQVDGPSTTVQSDGPIIDSTRVQRDLPPSPAGNFGVADRTDHSLTVQWTDATDDHGVVSYRLYRNGVLVSSVPATTHEATIDGLSACTSYAIQVRAVDTADQLGSAGGQPILRTAGCPTGSVSGREIDRSTQGDWIGHYGGLGYRIAGDATKTADRVDVQVTRGTEYTWDSAPADKRALQRADGSGRVAGTWFGDSVELSVTSSGGPHRISLYLLDWDGGGGRRESLMVRDPSGAVLDTLSAGDLGRFDGGTMVSWNVTGSVTITADVSAGANAVVSAAFVDPPR